MKRRLNYLDLAKGLLISLVVFHHIPYVLRNVDPSIYIEDMIKMEVFYTSFFMCAFFMITGMTFCPNGTLWTFVKKNFRALILPGILLAIINRITLSYLLGKELRIDIIGLLVRGGEYWFLTSLFCSKILVYLLLKWVRLYGIMLITICMSVFVVIVRIGGIDSNLFYIQQTFMLTPYLYIGYLLKDKIIGVKWTIVFSLLYFLFVLYVISFHYESPCLSMVIKLDNTNLIPFYVLSICGSFLVIKIAMCFKRSTFLEAVGRKYLYIYLTHITILYVMILFFRKNGIMQREIMIGLTFIGTLFISYLLAAFLQLINNKCYVLRNRK